MKVLVVDDDPSIRSAVSLVLSIDDDVAEVRCAEGGADALRVVETFEADVVLMDYWMPEMDGSETARALRAHLPEARIVAYSGVLFDKPDWADGFILKDRLPEAAELISGD
ncbi:MAG: two-component system, NarL family, nitrate/nitrite response regulator NarL [Actinomycetota bacterium]|jgi:CheY-like chemotaxis protein|nr:two-component system, NarL family, nitrate/nitrite response regulator NarL [Actinomycetota bacterium]